MSDVKDQVKSEVVDELSKFAKLALAFLMFMGSRRASRDLSASQVVSEFEHVMPRANTTTPAPAHNFFIFSRNRGTRWHADCFYAR